MSNINTLALVSETQHSVMRCYEAPNATKRDDMYINISRP
jgi:hypothetical protein